MKKFLSLALALVMTFSLVTISAGAKEFKDDSKITYADAVAVISEIGVVDGYTDGNFQPQNVLTRGAAAKIICNMILGPTTAAALSADAAPFKDVPANHTFAGYIAYCAQNGIINGYADGTFRPAGELNGYAFMKMLLGALGYDGAVEGYTGANWSINVAKRALNIGLDDGNDDFVGTKSVTREEACLYAFNALQATMVEYDNNATITVGDVVISTNSKAQEVTNGKTELIWKNGTLEFAEKYFTKLSVKEGDEDDFGRPSTTWSYDGDEIGTYADDADYVFVLDDNYTEDDLIDTIQDLADDDDLKLASKAKFYINGDDDKISAADVEAVATYGTVVELYVDEDDDDVITDVIAYNYTLYQIDEVDDDVTSSDAKKGISCYVTINGTDYDDVDVPGFDADTYVEDAYVAAIINPDGDIIACGIADSVKNSISTVKGNDYITVAGTKYYAGVNYTKGDAVITFSSLSTSSDDTYAVYTDPNGFVIGIEGIESGANIDDVYYVDVIWTDTKTVAGAEVTTHYAQLVDMDGNISEIKLESVDKNEGTGAYTNAAYAGELVTVSDKKWTDKAGTTHKASNDKFDLAIWDNDDFKVATAAGFTKDFTKSASRITTAEGKTYRLNSSTVYLFVEGTKNDLDVSVYTGGVAYAKDDVKSAIVITEDDSSVALYVIILTDDAGQSAEYSEDVIFIKSASNEKGDGYRNQTVYLPDGSKETWAVDEDEYALDAGFYTYDTNSDGYYVLDAAEEIDLAKSFVWDDEEGVILAATFNDADNLYETLLTVSVGNVVVSDIETSGAVFKDLHDTDKGYSKTVKSLSALADLLDNGKVASATLYLNISEDGAVTIFATAIA